MPQSEVWYIPTDGAPIRVGLTADGAADLSALPEDVREHLVGFGVQDQFHRRWIKSSEGQKFLAALPAASNGYMTFVANRPSSDAPHVA